MSKKQYKNNLGFSLLELLIIIAILAIITISVLVIYSGLEKQARDTKRKADIKTISQALEFYYNKIPNENCLAPAGTYCRPLPTWFNGGIPVDPATGATYEGVLTIINGDNSYKIWTTLEDGQTFTLSNRQ